MKLNVLSNVLDNLRLHFGIIEDTNFVINESHQGLKVNRNAINTIYDKIYQMKYQKDRDPLRRLQIHMLSVLQTSAPSEGITDLLPIYFKPSDIILFYDINTMELGLFFEEKYCKTRDGEKIQSDIVMVKFNSGLHKDPFGDLKYDNYFTKRFYYKYSDHPGNGLSYVTWDFDKYYLWVTKIGNRVLTNLFPCVFDYETYETPRIKYLEGGITDEKLALDLASTYYHSILG